MQTEIEAKFLNVDHDDIRQKLKKLGAVCKQPMRLMKRKNFDFPDNHLEKTVTGWVRIRDEGNKVTLSYKQLNDRTLHGTKEINLHVDSFEEAQKMLEAIGLEEKSYQETKRESWVLDGVEIELDEWPWVPTFIELEGTSEAQLKAIAQSLGLDWSSAVHGSVEVAYQAVYEVTEEEIDHLETITFTPVPAWLEKRRKNETN